MGITRWTVLNMTRSRVTLRVSSRKESFRTVQNSLILHNHHNNSSKTLACQHVCCYYDYFPLPRWRTAQPPTLVRSEAAIQIQPPTLFRSETGILQSGSSPTAIHPLPPLLGPTTLSLLTRLRDDSGWANTVSTLWVPIGTGSLFPGTDNRWM